MKRFVGLGSIVAAWTVGVPAWLLVYLTMVLLVMCVLALEPEQIKAFGQLLGKHRGDASTNEKASSKTLEHGKSEDDAAPTEAAVPKRQRSRRRRRRRRRRGRQIE